MVIQHTADYGIFKHMEGNRHIKPAHVKALMESLEAHPNLRPARPILCNEHMFIIDGQHRLEASKRLKMEVYYTVVPGLTIADARLINALQRSWTLLEYAESFSLSGEPAYKFFMEMHADFPIPAASLIVFMTGGKRHRQGEAFRRGEFHPDNRENVLKRLYKLEDFKIALPKNWTEQAFALAVAHLINHDDYDHDRMMRKMQEATLTRSADRAGYLYQLEDIYNKGNPQRTRFF